HDVAMTGLFVHENTGSVSGADMRGDITGWARNIALDPHVTKGSGLHGAYIGVTSSTGYSVSGTFILHVHDDAWGGGVQLGPHLVNSEVQVRAENLTYSPPPNADGTGGNAIQAFGDSQSSVKITDVEASNVRRAVEASGLSSSVPAGTFAVSYGKTTGSVLNPYDTSKVGISYTNCT